jgi:glycosyltransferase involved in cell wall biosynthesis
MESGVAKKVWQARAVLGGQADVVVLPNEQRLAAFQAALRPRGRCYCVWNCPSLDEVPEKLPTRQAPGPLRVLYHGSIVPERFGPYVLEAAARCGREVEVTLIGYLPAGCRGYIQELEQAASQWGIRSRFAYLGPMSHHEVLARSQEHDVGLCLLRIHEADINMQHMVGASNKAFDYLSQGLALIVPDDPAWRALYVETACARPCPSHDADALADVFRWMADHRTEVAEMGRRGHALIQQRWNYEAQFAPVLERMQNAIDA